MSTTAPVETVDHAKVIVDLEAEEKAADDRAILRRAQQKELIRRSLREDVSTALGQVERAIDKAARDAERARMRREAALEEQRQAGMHAQADARTRARIELDRLEAQRREHLVTVESHLQALAGELVELRRLEADVLTCRGTLGLGGLGTNVSRMIGDRLSFVLGRGAGSAGLSSLPPLASKGQARTPLPDLFAAATEDRV